MVAVGRGGGGGAFLPGYKVFPGLFVRQGTCLAGMCLVLSAGPPHLSLQVVANHPYTGEEEDELTFEKGEIVSCLGASDWGVIHA